MTCIHDFTIVGEDDTIIVEKCQLCGQKEKYNKVAGKIDNEKYLADHKRDFCQPGGRTDKLFKQLYGDKS